MLEVIKKVEENDRRTQSIDLSGSSVFREKSVKLSASLADSLSRNTRLTALDLSNCSIGDVSAKQLSAALADNATLSAARWGDAATQPALAIRRRIAVSCLTPPPTETSNSNARRQPALYPPPLVLALLLPPVLPLLPPLLGLSAGPVLLRRPAAGSS